MSESCSASSSSIVVGSGPRSRAGAGAGSSSSPAAGASTVSASLTASEARRRDACIGHGRLDGARSLRGSTSAARRRPRLSPVRRRSGLGDRGHHRPRGASAVAAGSILSDRARAATSWASGAAVCSAAVAARLGIVRAGVGSSRVIVASAMDASSAGTSACPRWWRARQRRCVATALLGRRGASAVASDCGLVPPVWSSVNGLVSPVLDSLPRITNGLSEAQAVSGPIKWSVVIDSAVRSFVRGIGLAGRSSAVLPSGPGESSTRLLAATIGRPCPNCPT